jgi:hypothetical protein
MAIWTACREAFLAGNLPGNQRQGNKVNTREIFSRPVLAFEEGSTGPGGIAAAVERNLAIQWRQHGTRQFSDGDHSGLRHFANHRDSNRRHRR